MTVLHDPTAAHKWLDHLGIQNLIVISPHLDDAVYSLAGFLGAVHDRTEVITCFTDAAPGKTSDWARATGFPDDQAEHLSRRQEDIKAMHHLGCRFQHLGLRPGKATAAFVSQVVNALELTLPGGLSRTLVLLPAGAGGPPPRSRLKRLLARLLRRPSGAMPHDEHIQIRNLFWHALANSQARVGFYAELPYAWAHSDQQLQQRLHGALRCSSSQVQYLADLERKREVVEMYQSQLIPILGRRASYRSRVLARDECIFIVDPFANNERETPQSVAG